ncbi:MAG: DUF4136 domain-containing protein [Cyclobacteriaceae bacterium]
MRAFSTVSLLTLLLFASCMGYKEFPVESDYSFEGDFRRYKTFNFLDTRSSGSDSSLQNDIIESAIRARMELQGYEYTTRDPRLLVSYKIFYDSLFFTGYDQPDIELFIEYEENIDQEMDPVKYNLRQGTLLVLMYDRERKKSIWQGYASGVFGDSFYSDKRYLQGAVRSIFDQYKVFAEGFVVEKRKVSRN